VNAVSKSIFQVAGLARQDGSGEQDGKFLYNVAHPRSFSWKNEFLPKLKESGMVFEILGYREWLQKLRESEDDLVKNPSRKLLGFWESQSWGGHGEIKFDVGDDDRTTQWLRTGPRVVDRDLVSELVAAWVKMW
jgi:hypothetical protein